MAGSESLLALSSGVAQTLALNLLLSLFTCLGAFYYVGFFIPKFIERKFFGRDMCKVTSGPVAEPLGVVAAAVYLISIFLFIPVPFYEWRMNLPMHDHAPYVRLLSLLAGLISICTAILLGFADDMLDLKWRHKLLFPLLSSFPLVMVYIISGEKTGMLLPNFVHPFIGRTYVDFSYLFYVYIIMLVIFCTNAINIIAGINGVEVGQSVVIALSVALFNLVQIARLGDESVWCHCLSFCMLGPFVGASLGLLAHNRFPARAFVGDTYCYFAGMTLAVVAVIGHFSKTLLLFLVPQVFNFLYSCPQLFHLIPCPRHRLPRLNKESGLLEMSRAEFQWERLSTPGRLIVTVLCALGLLNYAEEEKEGERWAAINNMTILNLLLKLHGPQPEWRLNALLLRYQAGFSLLAFGCRFWLAGLLYENVF